MQVEIARYLEVLEQRVVHSPVPVGLELAARVVQLDSRDLEEGEHAAQVDELLVHLELRLLAAEVRRLLERLGQVLDAPPAPRLALHVRAHPVEAPLETLLPALPVHHVRHVLRVEVGQHLLAVRGRRVAQHPHAPQVRLDARGGHRLRQPLDCLAHFRAVLPQAHVVLAEQVFELREPLLLERVKAPAAPVRARLPVQPGSLRPRAARVVLPLRLETDRHG